VESVNEMAQPEQIGETAENAQGRVIALERLHLLGSTLVPAGPLGWDQRAAAVGQPGEQKQHTAPPDAADHLKRAALEGVALAGDRRRIGKITAMGSLPPLPSIRSAKNGWSAS
jgi:hypothetical protein